MSPVLYLSVGSNDLARSVAFYDAVLGAIGHGRKGEPSGGWATWGPSYEDGVSFNVCRPFDGQPATAGNGTMISFGAKSAEEVKSFHAAALQNGGSCEGEPGLREAYGPNFYVAYVRDPDGNKLACAFPRYGK
ncbi:catechol 2,3-dioxygenase-like lactoylglutathione lyase family enzyme [Rhodoligotrophos appendicifer]|uniref:VOC family protein n=1 Tax=Rhodoligotrophos appendicifer TaxID=987056 RepID=UPI00117C34EB|nr:VOC family protein [Rhodoligotrophos appendicifer]